MALNNPVIKKDDQQLDINSIGLCIELSPYVFTQEELDSDTQKLMGDKAFFKENNLKQGDKLIFEGSEFILYENHKTNDYITIAYSSQIEDFNYTIEPSRTQEGEFVGDVKFWGGKLSIYGKQDIATKFELDILKDIGVQPYPPSWGGIIVPIIMLFAIICGGIVSLLVVYSFTLKTNSRRYAIYKIVGMTPNTVSGIMLAESFALTSIGVTRGLVIELLINALTKIDVLIISKLLWAHCITLVLVTLMTTLITALFKIIALTKAVPVASKYLQ